ncbi:hypothetical protein AC579_9902 [Pseudocercospora musae]|uniref:Uncharacterized protein n=1 Tax=Pseudocercospora musae TaxID=113226 RepID=A0A139IFC6_9PEZI|nr:hypothetical protein AC579_9902 [Pseudocercospora musae]
MLLSVAVPFATAAPVPLPQFPGWPSFGAGAGSFDITKLFEGLSTMKSSGSSGSSSSDSTTNLSDLVKYFQDLQKASSSSGSSSSSSDMMTSSGTFATVYWKAILDFWKAIYEAYEKQQMSGSAKGNTDA